MNRKFIKNSNLVLRKILHSNDALDVIKDFIETFLKTQIKSITINQTPTIDGKISKEYGIVDVRIKTQTNEELNVGIQIIDGDYIQNKILFYFAKIHSNQILYNDNRKIVRTVTINILDTIFLNSEQYHRIINFNSNEINNNISEKIELHVLELPKLKVGTNEMNLSEEDWGMYLRGANINEINIAKKRNSKIKKLDNLLVKYWEEEEI